MELLGIADQKGSNRQRNRPAAAREVLKYREVLRERGMGHTFIMCKAKTKWFFRKKNVQNIQNRVLAQQEA